MGQRPLQEPDFDDQAKLPSEVDDGRRIALAVMAIPFALLAAWMF